jgi:hypothetical protein
MTTDLLAALERIVGRPLPEPLPWDEARERRTDQASTKAWLDRHYGEGS